MLANARIALLAPLVLCSMPLATSPAYAQTATSKGESPFLDAQTYAETGQRPSKAPRIVGGPPAPEGAYPWQVSIAVAGRPFAVAHFCGGALIDALWVVTAAHCLQGVQDATRLQIMYGSNDLGRPGKVRKVASMVVHPGWNRETLEHDLALLKLATPAMDGIPIKLLEKDTGRTLFHDDVSAFVSGWGDTKEGGMPSQILRHVGVEVVSESKCNAPGAYDGRIKGGMFCAGFAAGGRDACQGDSGGPIMVSDRKGSYVLAGVVSWGEGCAQPNKYGVYTRISDYLDWIRDNKK